MGGDISVGGHSRAVAETEKLTVGQEICTPSVALKSVARQVLAMSVWDQAGEGAPVRHVSGKKYGLVGRATRGETSLSSNDSRLALSITSLPALLHCSPSTSAAGRHEYRPAQGGMALDGA